MTLSLTLGAAASIFAVLDAVVLTPPPVADPGALVTLGEIPLDDAGAAPRAVSYATFEAWRDRAASLAVIEALDGTNLTLTGIGPAERLSATNVTPGFLDMLGIAPAIGRRFVADDAGQPVAIISDALWREKLGADRAVVGRQLLLGGRAHTVVGVLPERFTFALASGDVWRPFPFAAGDDARAGFRVFGVARVAPNVTPEMLGAALSDVSRASSPRSRAEVTSLTAAIAGSATNTLAFLAGAAGVALFVAFTNLTGLLIVRGIERRRELAVRAALGARRFEMVRLPLLETATIVAVGLGGGVLLALWMTPLVARLALEQFGASAADVSVSWRVIAVVSLIAIVCAAASASVPALAAAKRGVVDVLRRGVTAAPRELFLRRALVTAEVALAFSLLVCMTLLGSSLVRTLLVHPGFEADGVIAMQVALPTARYSTSGRIGSFYTSLWSALEERLGTGAVAIVNEIPLTGDGGRRLIGASAASRDVETIVREASEGYFDVMRIPVVAGRGFDRGDDSGAPARGLLSESLAQRLFGREAAVGREIFLNDRQGTEIIGVVGDVKHRALDERLVPTLYLSAAQSPSASSIVVARSVRPAGDVLAAVREEVTRLDADVPVYRSRPMSAVVEASPGVPTRRVLTAAFVGFAVLALVLAALGLFGVVAHDVARRRAEIALRLALGAEPRRILGATLAQATWMVATGLAIGSVLVFWTARVLDAVLFATELNAATIAGVGILFVAVGAAAVLPAAVRAANTDPVSALRGE